MTGKTHTIPMLAIPDPRCEMCAFYHMIDSGFGYCTGLPPTEPHHKTPWWERLATFFHIYCIHEKSPRRDYPYEGYRIVPWDIVTCRLFKYFRSSHD